MFTSLRQQIGRQLFGRRCRGVLDLPPAGLVAGNEVLVLSLLQHKDVMMYLVAIKTFCAHVSVGEVLVVDDGSLNSNDHDLLRFHVPRVRIEPMRKYGSPRCPRGGTWERLLAVCAHVTDRYVIQLDADTVSVGPLTEVESAATRGSSFALGTWDNQVAETLGYRAAEALRHHPADGGHVQVVAEKAFNRMPQFEGMRYVRGCSGFAGFAPRSTSREFVETFSEQIATLIGDRWSEWGSEQVMSNVALANSPKVEILPHPKYCDCNHITPQTVFVHFIGDCRFQGATYRRAGSEQVRHLGRVGREALP